MWLLVKFYTTRDAEYLSSGRSAAACHWPIKCRVHTLFQPVHPMLKALFSLLQSVFGSKVLRIDFWDYIIRWTKRVGQLQRTQRAKNEHSHKRCSVPENRVSFIFNFILNALAVASL
jgi:hypothetical protein